MKPINVFYEVPANKAGVAMFAESIVNTLLEGDVDPLDVRVRIDAIEQIIKTIKADPAFRDVVMDAADMHGAKSFDHLGVKFTLANVSKYDYSDDQVWCEINEEIKRLTAIRKKRETILKALTETTEIDGVESNPPLCHTTQTVKVTL